ncbi:protocadherin alpha-C2-like [Vipera latastei]
MGPAFYKSDSEVPMILQIRRFRRPCSAFPGDLAAVEEASKRRCGPGWCRLRYGRAFSLHMISSLAGGGGGGCCLGGGLVRAGSAREGRGGGEREGSQGKRMRVYLMVCCLVFCTVRGQVEYSIAEETERGAPVGNLAQDLGIDATRLPSRRFRMITGSSKQYFHLNASTGVLSVNEPVDREEICAQEPTCSLNYELVLETPLELYKLQFKILDVNDHAPTFLLEEYHVNVAEFLAPGVRFTLPVAHDLDEGINSVQSYILSPNQHFRLEMQTRGDGSRYPELVLEKSLDREQQAIHRLTITAKDGGSPQRSGAAQVVVNVLDTNDNAPTFEHSVYRANVLENSPRGTLVTRVQATDLDEGQNGEVFYSFSNSTSPELQKMFSINSQNGEIKVSGALNVQKPLLEMFIEARDKGVFGMSSVAKLLVEITDVNNNAPEITLTSLSSPIPEDSLLGTVVALLSITDEDPGENGKIICKVPVDIPFQLRSSFDDYYSLITSGLLDREQVSDYNITITATDAGTPPLSSHKVIKVDVSDINDNAPQFQELPYSIYIPENNAPGSSLCTTKATDLDAYANAYISYSLITGEIQGQPASFYVSIQSETGNIYAVRSFDYETLREFQIVVQAQDAGMPSLSSTATVHIYVLDQNDHVPQILYPISMNNSAATEMIPHSANSGYLVTKVIAIDGDSGQNAWLFFHLAQTPVPDIFRVEVHSGEIRTTQKLWEATEAMFNLTIIVRDNGEPPLSSSVSIIVVVVDRASQIIPDAGRHITSSRNYSEITLYLIVSLSVVSFIFLLTVVVLAVMKCHKDSLYSGSCCAGFCGASKERCPFEADKQTNSSVATGMLQPHLVEVRGNGSLSKTYCYKTCVSAGSGSDAFMFYNPGGTTGINPHAVMAERNIIGESGLSSPNFIIFKSDLIASNEKLTTKDARHEGCQHNSHEPEGRLMAVALGRMWQTAGFGMTWRFATGCGHLPPCGSHAMPLP